MPESSERSWVRSGVAAALVGMACWIIGLALIPVDARLQNGEEQLADLLRSDATRLYLAAGLAALGAVLLVVFSVALTQVVPNGAPGGGLLRLSLAGCLMTQTLVACGTAFGFAGEHAAIAHVDPSLVALAWRGLWLTFLVSAFPTVLFTAAAVLGLRQAGLSPLLGFGVGLGLGGRSRARHVHCGAERAICAGWPDRGDRAGYDGAVGDRLGRDAARRGSTLTPTAQPGWCGVGSTGRASLAGFGCPHEGRRGRYCGHASGVRGSVTCGAVPPAIPAPALRHDQWSERQRNGSRQWDGRCRGGMGVAASRLD